jgi:hypothetical protein
VEGNLAHLFHLLWSQPLACAFTFIVGRPGSSKRCIRLGGILGGDPSGSVGRLLTPSICIYLVINFLRFKDGINTYDHYTRVNSLPVTE